jgi:hypothetical protein
MADRSAPGPDPRARTDRYGKRYQCGFNVAPPTDRRASIAHTTTHGIGGPIAVNLYRIGLHIFDAHNTSRPWIFHPTLVVMELSAGIAFDVLIGMDILRTCKLFLDGPGGQFALDF